MQQGDNVPGFQGLLGFDIPGCDQAGLSGHRQGVKDRAFEEPLSAGDKV